MGKVWPEDDGYAVQCIVVFEVIRPSHQQETDTSARVRDNSFRPVSCSTQEARTYMISNAGAVHKVFMSSGGCCFFAIAPALFSSFFCSPDDFAQMNDSTILYDRQQARALHRPSRNPLLCIGCHLHPRFH